MLAKDGPYYNLDMPVKEALLRRTPDTLGRVLETIRTTTVHRFIVLRDDRLHGIISLRDILRYLISLN
nr:hypothetical protein HK105_002722 [Polyrhizophydium stewartii]